MRSSRLLAGAAVLMLAVTISPANAVVTAVTLGCTKSGVFGSAADVMAANLQTHAAKSDYNWSASSVQSVALKSSLTISKAGTYRLRGSIVNGQVTVNVTGNGVVRLILAGASITSTKGAALEVKAASKVIVVLQAGTSNALTDAKARAVGDTAAAVLYSKSALTITGKGSLKVNARYADGIASTDGLVITGGNITVNANDDGIRGKDYVYISGGTVSVMSVGDAIRSSGKKASTVGYVYIGGGKITINSKSDALQGSSDVVIAGGTLKIAAMGDAIKSDCISYFAKATASLAVGGKAMHSNGETVFRGGTMTITKAVEGLEGGYIEISGGTLRMTTSDDGLNVASSISPTATPAFLSDVTAHLQMSGGTVMINALGDGIDINGSATVTGGRLIVSGPIAEVNAALEVSTDFGVGGGLIFALGSAGVAMGPSLSSSQASIMGSFAAVVKAGSIVHVVDANGKVIGSFKSPKPFASIVYSSPTLVKGQSYKLYTGGSVKGTSLGGYYVSGSIAGASLYGSLTAGSYTSAGPKP